MRIHSHPVKTAAIAMMAAAFVLAGTACSKKLDPTSSADSIKTEVNKELTAQGSTVTISSVSCPSDIEAKNGVSFTCTLTLSNGKTLQVKGTQVDDTGKFNVEPIADVGAASGGSTGTTGG